MNISPSQVNNLWKIKIAFFSLRKTSSMFEMLWLAGFLFILPAVISHFNPKILITAAVTLVLNTSLFFYIRTKIDKLRISRKDQKYKYPYITVLFNLHSILGLLGLAAGSISYAWMFALMDENPAMEEDFLVWSARLTLATVSLAVVLSPYFLRNKSLQNIFRSNASVPTVLKVVPGVSIFLALALKMASRETANHILVGLCLFGFLLLIFMVILDGYELLFLLKNKCPIVRREKSNFIFLDETPDE